MRLSKIGDFSPIFGSGPFMPQLHPHPLMHRTPAAPVDLSEQFCPDTREGTRTVWHLTRAMTSEAMEMRVAENLLAQSEVHFGTPPGQLFVLKPLFCEGLICSEIYLYRLRYAGLLAFCTLEYMKISL